MTIPAILVAAGFDHVSERESDGSWEDCTWCSGLEWYRLCYDRTRPSTHTEMQALRAASGEPTTGGSNIGNLRDGIKSRYKETVVLPISGFTALKAALTPGHAAVVQGSMRVFSSTSRLSVWDRGFDGTHAVLVVNVEGTLYWCDPEAPETAAVPVVITWAELALFVNAFGGQHLVAPIKLPFVPKEDILNNLLGYWPDVDLIIKAESNIRADARIGAIKFRTVPLGATETHRAIGTVTGDVDPKNGSSVWYVWYANGRFEFTARDNVTTKPRPAVLDDGYTKATQDAAVAAAVAPLNSKIAVLQPLADIGSAAVGFIKKAVG